ncbi:MAG: SHOCT domain-containing protein [Candidatus Thiodiazotropha sp. (ex Troendleina suluensis)]|nr:SHOCT domain-containing protein [Candidatus Thiodiazotropha sp. (ex Troendleina suluensis)]
MTYNSRLVINACMMKFFKTASLFAFLLFPPWSIFSLGLFAAESIIWEAGANEYFKYAEQDTSDFGNNDHPAELNGDKIAAVLGSLIIRGQDQSDTSHDSRTIFTAQQAKLLGQHLAAGLSKARPQQDVIFAMERSVSRLYGLNSDRFFLAGRAFYKDKKLNIIIGDFDRPRDKGFEAAYDPTHIGIVRYNFNHGNRTKVSKGFKKTIIQVNGVENRQLNGVLRYDWLVIDVKSASETYVKKAKIRKKEEMTKKRAEIIQILDTKEVGGSTVKRELLEERFTTLKRLRDKGLINEEEYTQKKKQLLDDL